MRTALLAYFLLGAGSLFGQASARDSLTRQVDAYVATVQKAAADFLNTELSPAERLKAIAPHAIIYDEKQIAAFKSIALDDREPPEIRAAALHRIPSEVPRDERLATLLVDQLGNPTSPKVLRQEALNLAANLSFSHLHVLDVYRQLLDDPDPAFRVFAFTQLVINGDARAQQKLLAGLENPDSASLPAPTAIGILSMALKKEFYPAIYRVMQQTKDAPTRLEAIRALGYYLEARPKLIAVGRDPSENEEFREAALGALYAGDREHIIDYVTPILTDKSSPPRLQGVALQMTIDVRQNIAYRSKATTADAYDRLVQAIAADSGRDSEVRSIAEKYLRAVRPRF